MRISYLLVVMASLALSGCSSIKAVQPTNTQTHNPTKNTSAIPQPKKNPIEVSFYTNGENPSNPYTVVGNTTISKYNAVGIKRQTATIHDAMRSAAASMGGDAIINIKRNSNAVTGTVIMYQQSKLAV
ncbi:MAG: hypothetical protein ABI597_05605 [Gammaproteobacteria bacterium]